MRYLFFILLLLNVACNGSGGSDPKVSTPNITTDPTPEELTVIEEFMELVNDHRNTLGLDPLTHAVDITNVAQEHSENMADGSVAFGHDGFSARCSEVKSLMGGGNWCAENVAAGQRSAQAVFNSWMNSSGHRANIESTRATHMGLGFKESSAGTMYWTQLFLEL